MAFYLNLNIIMRLRFAFSKLLDEKLGKSFRVDRLSMTPHQYWVAVGKGMERPYTGAYWFVWYSDLLRIKKWDITIVLIAIIHYFPSTLNSSPRMGMPHSGIM